MLALLATAELLGMALWFTASAASPHLLAASGGALSRFTRRSVAGGSALAPSRKYSRRREVLRPRGRRSGRPPLPYTRRYSSTFLARTSSGTLPPRTTVSLNALRSYRAPSAA